MPYVCEYASMRVWEKHMLVVAAILDETYADNLKAVLNPRVMISALGIDDEDDQRKVFYNFLPCIQLNKYILFPHVPIFTSPEIH